MIFLLTHSLAPDLSVAGKQEGLIRGQTRSGLLYECEEIIEYCRPKYLLLENVKNLVGKKFKPQFDEWLKYLEGLGYTNYVKVLNAKDFGVPQNRERVFVVSILGEHTPYEFPKPIPLDKCIADILEDKVDEKYYINKPFHLVDKGHQAELDIKGQDCIKRVYSTDKIAPTLTTMQGGLREPKILEHKLYQNVKVRKYDVDINELKKTLKAAKNKSGLTIKDISCKLDKTKTTVEHWFRNDDCFSIPDEYVWLDLKKLLGITTDKFDKPIMEFEIKPNEYDMSNRAYHENGIAPTLTASGESGAKKILVSQSTEHLRIRKLTPRECFRLMGMREDDIDKIQQVGISNTQQYKMAGNSICVPVLEGIFRNLFIKK